MGCDIIKIKQGKEFIKMDYTTVNTKEIVTIVAYMAGIKEEALKSDYGDYGELLESLKKDKNATIIRYLNKIKTSLMLHFKQTDNEIIYNLANLDRLPQWFSRDEIMKLEEWGIKVLMTNTRADKYIEHISALINMNIDGCRHLFYEWIKFEYIRNLFYTAKYDSPMEMKKEFAKYMAKISMYPFQMYIHWEPKEAGNILSDDFKFLRILYSQNNDFAPEYSKMHDAVDDVKNSIYDFIDSSNKIVIAVDCENSDALKLYGMLKNLDAEKLSKIKKIMLYDDIHTSCVWENLGKFIKTPTEHMEVQRVAESKSLVDIRMTAGICAEYYKNDVDSFILCSSDSDFWGLISALPDARFMVMYESTKCGSPIMQAMKAHQIQNCCIDDFYTGNADDLKQKVLKDILKSHFPNIIGMNGMELAKQVYEESKIKYRQNELDHFYNKYIKTLRMVMDKEGRFKIEINDF